MDGFPPLEWAVTVTVWVTVATPRYATIKPWTRGDEGEGDCK